jgi:3-dehydroquinate dehydratase-1/3-dehydroquinate dehydratase/shikimate dehydrogenase
MANRGLICVAVAAADAVAVQAAVAPVLELVDVVEIRLDGMADPHLAGCITALGKPVLATNRPSWEGGQWQGSEQERIDLLCRTLHWGARYVDIELHTSLNLREQVLNEAAKVGAQVIISNHHFQATPTSDHLHHTLEQMMSSGADIGKIVVTASGPGDCLRILALQERAMAAGFPLCAFAMGAAGAISRLATLYLGGFMSYAALAPELATAPGQLSVQEVQALLRILERNND